MKTMTLTRAAAMLITADQWLRKTMDVKRGLMVALAGLALVVSVGSAAGSSTGALSIDTQFQQEWKAATCAVGTPATTSCYAFKATPTLRGLGKVSVGYLLLVDRPSDCTSWTMHGSVSASRGTLELTGASSGCQGFSTASLALNLAGNGGSLAGATGSGTFRFGPPTESGDHGTSIAYVRVELDAPGVTFDTDAPMLAGVTNRLVRAATKRTRVRFSVTATDAVDGPVAAVCRPRSGSLFPRGRTVVRCSASDDSGNVVQAQFTVTVLGKRH